MQPRLTVIAICKNEKANILPFLGSVGIVADEIVIADTGSTDGTQEELRRLGFTEKGRGSLKLRHFAWKDDFSAARNFALSHAKGNWVLWMDMDDRLFKTAPQYINQLKQQDRTDVAYGFQVACETEAPGTYVRLLQPRMFPNIRGIFWERPIHEKLFKSLDLKGIHLEPMQDCIILHTGYVDPLVNQRKALRNSKILEKLSEESYEKYYQLGDAYFAMNAFDIGMINYYKARGLAETDLQRNSATERIILGRMVSGQIDVAKQEFELLQDGTPEKWFYEASFAYAEKDYDRAGPLYEKILNTVYEPQSMNSYLDAYKVRSLEVLEKMSEMYEASLKEADSG
jgi:glycosyltransferase involved in cell wall biosynthesis